MKKLFSTKYAASSFDISMLLLRIAAGGTMAYVHGWAKLKNFTGYARDFDSYFGMSPTLSLSLAIFAEFFCAIFIVLGLFTRLSTIPLLICMSVAFFIAHHGSILAKGELSFIYLAMFLVILLVGPGRVSVDRLIGK